MKYVGIEQVLEVIKNRFGDGKYTHFIFSTEMRLDQLPTVRFDIEEVVTPKEDK